MSKSVSDEMNVTEQAERAKKKKSLLVIQKAVSKKKTFLKAVRIAPCETKETKEYLMSAVCNYSTFRETLFTTMGSGKEDENGGSKRNRLRS